MRLTRRGRLLITMLLSLCGVSLTLFTGTVSLAGTQSDQVPVRYVTVAPGETLWSIAGEVAPATDRRDTVQRIVDLNALDGPRLSVGQRIAVPLPR
jgi:LysM repeat protein